MLSRKDCKVSEAGSVKERVNRSVNATARAAAQAKKAVDYEAPRDAEDKRSAAEIERDIERVREELTATVDELAGRLSPDRLKQDLKAGAQEKLGAGKAKAQALVTDAKAGDKKAIGILAGSAAAVLGLVLIKIIKH